MKKGTVYLVGAGPGDPGLLTLKGKNCLQQADVIVYDRLINNKILSYADTKAELIYVGKSSTGDSFTQDRINEILALAGLPPLAKRISRSAAWRVGAVLEAVYRTLRIDREPPMTRFLAAQLSTSHYFDIRRARHDFGYAPSISIAEGMKQLAAELARANNDR